MLERYDFVDSRADRIEDRFLAVDVVTRSLKLMIVFKPRVR
jgi:hypothetical protein